MFSGIMSEVEKDILYFQKSGGGLRFTGGEPLSQPEFSAGILKECRKRNIHTAIETSLFCGKNAIDLVSDNVDLFFDRSENIRQRRSRVYTGKGNEIIRGNFSYLARQGKNIIVRIPLIKIFTDTENNINAITQFVAENP